MRKSLLYLCLITSVFCKAQDCDFLPFYVALDDSSGSNTNVRDEPNGAIVLQLNKEDLFVLRVVDYKNDWLKIDAVSSIYNGYDISNIEAWINKSLVSMWTRKKITLLDKPKIGTILGFIEGENGPVNLTDICGKWAKITFKNLSGWVELELLCGNPVTTCP